MRDSSLLGLAMTASLGMMILCLPGVAAGQASDAELLAFVNHCTTTSAVLEVDVGLPAQAANSIAEHRDGQDALCDTPDDDPFETVLELENVPFVGLDDLEALRAHAATWQPPDPDADLLAFVNHCTTTSTVLDDDVGLTSRAAGNIVAHRDGTDSICGTADDDPFDNVTELDNVPYVGASALAALRTYAQTWQPPTSDVELLAFVNHCTTTFTVLDDDAGLTSRAASNIVSHRDGPDSICGTADDDLFDSATELDSVPYVGTSALAALRAYAGTWQPPASVPAMREWCLVLFAVLLLTTGLWMGSTDRARAAMCAPLAPLVRPPH